MTFPKKTLVLTGATGFMGSYVTAHALERGHRVIVLLRDTSNISRIHDWIADCVVVNKSSQPNAELAELIKAYEPDAWIHLAWRGVGGADRNESFQISTNLPDTLDSLTLATAAGCHHWIGMGSQAEYGNPNCKITEECPTNPTTIYGKSKLASYWAAMGYTESVKMDFSWIRVFSTYGPKDHAEWLIPYLIGQFSLGLSPELTACEQRWDYLYVEDAAAAILDVVEARATGVYNLGSGTALPLMQIVEQVASLCESHITPSFGKIPYRPDQVMWLESDITKLTEKTGWRPRTDIETGLKRTVEWHRNSLPLEKSN